MRYSPFRLFALAGSALALAACGHDNPRRPSTVITATRVDPVEQREAEFVKLLPSCPVSDEKTRLQQEYGKATAPVVAAVLAPVVIDFAVSAVRDYLQRVENEHTGSFMAAGAGTLPESGTACLVVGRGVLGKPVAALPKQGSLEERHMIDVGLARPPAFYMEARIATTVLPTEKKPEPPPATGGKKPVAAAAPEKAEAQVRTVLEFAPQLIHFAKTVAKRGQDEEKTIAAVVVLRSTTAPEAPTSTTASKDAEAVFPLKLGALVPGTEVRPSDFAQVADHPLADLRRTTTFSGKLAAANLYAFITESDDPGKVLVLLNKSLERQGDGLQKALNKAVEDALKPAK